MDLKLKNKNFVVCGATSGFGLAITKQLIDENAKVIAIARGEEKLRELKDAYYSQLDILIGDITQSETIQKLMKLTKSIEVDGLVVNAAGPPAKKFIETELDDWDNAYRQLVRWKVEITQSFLPVFLKQLYGRFLYIESSSVKQPLENLVLSTSLRLSVVGFVKTVSQEIPDKGVTFNIIAPGYHYTAAVERLIDKKARDERISKTKAKQLIEQNIPMKKTGDVDNFASLAVWLLSPKSEYITGQVFTIDGAVVKSTL